MVVTTTPTKNSSRVAKAAKSHIKRSPGSASKLRESSGQATKRSGTQVHLLRLVGVGISIAFFTGPKGDGHGFVGPLIKLLRGSPEEMEKFLIDYIATRQGDEPHLPLKQDSGFTVPCMVILTEIDHNDEEWGQLTLTALVKKMNAWGASNRNKPTYQVGGDVTDNNNPRVLDKFVTEKDTMKIIMSLYSDVDNDDLAGDDGFIQSFFGQQTDDIKRGKKLVLAIADDGT
jgi:hypothetical protein